MGFDVEGARKAGYSDDEIAGYLSEKSGFDLKGALGSGYSAREVIDHLSPPRVDLPSGVTPSDAGAGRGRADDPRRTDAGLIQSARSAPMLYGEDPTTGPMQPQSSMSSGAQTAIVTDPSGDGSVLKGVKFQPPGLDIDANRETRKRSVSPDSVMFKPGKDLDRVDAAISRGEKVQAALRKAGYSSVEEFQSARQRSAAREQVAEESPILSGVASGAANQVAGLMNFPQVTAEFVNKAFVDPVLTAAGGAPMPSAPKTPGTEALMRAAADYMPKVGKKEFEDVVGTDEFRPWLIANMAQNSPQMVMSLASMLAPAVRPFVLPGMGATSAGNAYLQGDDPRVAMAKGAVEVGSEMLPLGVFDKIQSAIASMPRSAQKRFLADVGKRVMSGGAAVAATALTGGAEEWIAQYGGNVLDKYAQGKNIPLDKGAAGAYVLGAAMGTGMGMPHIISAMGDQSPQAQAERELAALLNGGQFSDLRGDEFANLNPNLAESDPGPTSSDQPASAADIFAQRWGKPKPAVPDPVATVQSATSIDGAITAAAQAVDAAFNERDRQQAKSEQAVSNIARILGTEIPDVGTAAAVPGVVEPAAGGGAPDAAAGVGAGVGVAGVAGQPVDAGGVGGQPTGRPVPLGAGQPGALNFAQPPGPVRQITVTPAGTLTAIGDPKALVRLLKSAGVTNVIPATNGITVGKSQASMARQVLDDFVAAPPENFEQDFQQELEREYQADIKAQLLAKRNPQPVKVEKKTQSPLRTMLRTVGIKPELAADITGESNRVRANNVLPFTFRKNGVQIDELVRIARERGFLTQDEDDIAAGRRLIEMIQADLRGDRQESTETIDDAMRGEQDAEIARAAARLGLDTSGMDARQVGNAVNRIERRLARARADGIRREAQAEARIEREAIQAADRRAAGPDRVLDDLDDVPENNATLEDAMRALGFTEQEITDAVAQESRRAQADRAGSGGAVAPAAGPAQGSDRRGESQARQEAGGAESRPQDLLGDAPNASQQEAARLRAEREEQDRRRQQAAPEAGGFMLSGSDRARDVGAAAGQGDLPAGTGVAPRGGDAGLDVAPTGLAAQGDRGAAAGNGRAAGGPSAVPGAGPGRDADLRGVGELTEAQKLLQTTLDKGKPFAISQYGDGTIKVGASLNADTHVVLHLTAEEKRAHRRALADQNMAETPEERIAANAAEQAALLPAARRAASGQGAGERRAAEKSAESLADLRAGKAGNERYRLFLSTMTQAERDAMESTAAFNVAFMSFINARSGEFKQQQRSEQINDQEAFTGYIREWVSKRGIQTQEGEAGQVERPLYARGDSSLPDEERSQNFRRWSNDAPLVTSSQAGTYQFKSGRKVVVEAFHGTKRPDRVGTVFQRNRATSGPMAFFTSSPLLASSYAEGKQDTSLSYEEQDYANWFKYKPKGERTPVDIVRAWYRLPAETKKRIADLAPRVRFSEEQEEDGGNKIELGPEDHASGTGSYDYNLDETKTRFDPVGNPLKALVEDWLNSANLFNDEERFLQVLRLAGFPVNDIAYDSPHSEYPFVYKAYVFMQKPLVTSDIPQEVRDALNAAAKRDRSRPAQGGADMWDKNTRSLREWVAAFNGDRPEYVWTSIPDKVTEVFKSLGYDGIIDWSGKGGGTEYPVYIPFEETQVKSAIGNKGNFNRGKKDILLARSEPSLWYSELSRKIGEAKMNASNPEGWKAFLSGLPQKGVKPDEIEWSGIREWLGLQQGKVTKQQLLDYLQANGVQVQEVVKGGMDTADLDAYEQNDGSWNIKRISDRSFVTNVRGFADDPEGAIAEAARRMAGSEGTKYATYQLPGGTNYREVLLTLPSKTVPGDLRSVDTIAREMFGRGMNTLSAQEQEMVRSRTRDDASANYRSNHWTEPNILAHIRLNDRTDAEGKRVLFVEEIQSDWAQAGRKHGINKPKTQAERAEMDAIQSRISAGTATMEDRRRYTELADETSRVPAAPFIDSTDKWLTLALKRVMVMAAQEGYDRVAFVNGEQSADRYSLSKSVDSINWQDLSSELRTVQIDMQGSAYGGDIGLKVNKSGVVEIVTSGPTDLKGKNLEDVIGKAAAEKIMAEPKGNLSGDGLKIGGEGMIAFYDKIVPAAVNKLLGKVGGGKIADGMVARESAYPREFPSEAAATEWAEANLGDHEFTVRGHRESDGTFIVFDEFTHKEVKGLVGRPQPGFTITPAMREKLAGGMPLFGREDSMSGMQGADIAQVRAIVDGIRKTWKGGPSVEVVASYRDLPGRPVPGARGMYIGGKVYVVASSHRAGGNLRQAVAKTLSHEVIAHYGLRKILGADFDRLLTKPLQLAIASGNKPMTALRDQVRRLYVDEDGNYTLSKREESDEIAARAVENAIDAEGNFRPGYSWLKSVWARVAQFLRDRGIDVPFTQAELQGMLVQAQQAVRDGERLAGASTVVVTQQPVLSRRSAEDVAPAEGFWSKIKAGKSFTPQEIADAYARGVRGTVRTFAGFSGEKDRVAAVPGTEHAGWRDEIAGFDGYVTVGVSFADGSLAMGVIPRELYPGRGSSLGLADLGEYSLATYAFTPNPDGSYRLDVFDPRRGGRVFDELARRGRLEETGDTDVAGQPYYRAVFDNRYTTSHSLIQEAVRRLGYHLGAVPTVVQIGRDTGSRANPGKEQVRTFTPEFIERRLARAFHGTPHRGIEKFSTDKIGTGEGAQAFGWGLYFASRREIAEHYRKTLQQRMGYTLRGKKADELSEAEALVLRDIERKLRASDWSEDSIIRLARSEARAEVDRAERALSEARQQVGKQLDAGAGWGELRYSVGTESDVADAEARLALAKRRLEIADGIKPGDVAKPVGQLYEVEIPEDSEMLLWDKPMSEQPEKVRKALQDVERDRLRVILSQREAARAVRISSGQSTDALDRQIDVLRDEVSAANLELHGTGERYYRSLSMKNGGDRAASELLSSLGIKGIKYLDGGSRADGDGSYNYVIFSGDDVAIQAALYARGEDQTNTPAFRKWFGDSVVTDNGKPMSEGGRPLVVYHGTDSVFTEFSRTGDIGHHFGTEIAARDRAARVGGAEVLVEPVTLSQVEKDSLSSLNGEIGGTPAADLYALLLRKLDSPRQNLRAQVEAMPADEIKKVKAEYLEQPDSLRFAERVDRAKAGEGFRVEVNGETVSTHRTVREANARAARLRERAATPMALYLRIENPIRLPDLGVWPAQEIAKEAGFSKREMERVVEAGTAEQQYEAVRAILESKGFDGIVYRNEVEHAGEDSYIAFRPEQIKSAIGNNGEFDPANPDIRYALAADDDFDANPATEPDRTIESWRVDLAPALATAMRRWEAGRATDADLAAAVRAELDNRKAKREDATDRDRVRGSDWMQERILRARRTGQMSTAEADLALWLLNQAPQVATDLGISIKSGDMTKPNGTYNVLERVVTIFTSKSNPDTLTHEILHHAERMMPEPVQNAIRKEWLKQLEAESKKVRAGLERRIAKSEADPRLKQAVGADQQRIVLLDWMLEAARKGDADLASSLYGGFRDGISLRNVLPYELSSPSEFWAVNAASLVRQRAETGTSLWRQARQWLVELMQKAKYLLGLRSNAPVIHGLEAVLAGDGSFVTRGMISTGARELNDQTDTPAFRRWFGDSKVVDENGKPLVVYHGTRADIAAFDGGRIKDRFPNSEGFYFTSNPSHASVYADSINNAAEGFNPASRFAKPATEGGNVMPVYVSLQNPKILTVSEWGTLESAVDGDGGARVRAARAAGHDGVIVKRRAGDGYDGDLVIAFRPEQIKSAIGNNGEFDPANPDIRYALAADDDFDADEAPAQRSRWLDDAGRLRFLPGTVVYDLLGKAATPLLNRLYLKTQSKPLRRAIREMKLTVQKAQDTAEEIGREVVKLTDAEREMVSDIIEKELATGVIPPEHAVKLAATMNEVLGKQTDELVKLGMLATDTAEQWRGKYLARYYKDKLGARVQSAWDKAISTFGAKPMRGLRGNHFKGRGLFEVIPEAELPAWEANGWEVRDPDYQEGITKDGTVRVWRDFTRAEREKMGEIRDAGFRFVMGYMETQKDIALGRMFQAIAADPELSSKYQTEELSEQVPDGTIAGTGVKKYGKLAGRWVSKETISHLSQIEESQSEAFKMYRKAMGLWKEGKALAIDTPIPTPTGWKTMGDVQEGDTVFDEQGKPCRVTYATGVQMDRACYEVEFSDGAKIVADEEHLWFTVYHSKGSVKTTKQILDTLKERTRGDNNHSIPVAGALQTPDVDLPIPPYALGAWLGDGTSSSASMCAGPKDADEIAQHVRDSGLTVGAYSIDKRNGVVTFGLRYSDASLPRSAGLQPTMRRMGLLNNKHIPAIYLRASERQRRELLCGLMDTDGHICESGKPAFSTTLPQLRDGFLELTRSLGYKPTCVVSRAMVKGKDCGETYRIQFTSYSDDPVFKLARKAARLLPRPETRQRSGTRQIVAIRPVPSVPVKCIQVDSESRLYLAGASMIPTHNTSLNPVAHANNIVSNITMAHFAGVSYWDVHKYAKAMRDFATNSDAVKEAKDAGLFLGTVSDAELMNVLPEDLKAIVRQQEGALTKVGSNAFNAMTWFLRRPMGAAYQAEDTFFRYLIWKDARDQGMSAEDAVDYSLRYIFAYDDLPLRARQIRDFMIPFFAYTYKAIPALLHTAANYPWRFAAPAAVMWGINAAAYAIAVGDDDDDWIERLQKYLTDPAYREKARAKEKMEREYLPEWMKGETIMNTPKAIRLGMDEVTKLPLFIDVYRMVPGGDMLDMNNNAGGTPWLQPFTPNHPLLTTYMAMFGNRDGWTGKDVVDKTDDSTEAAQKRLGWMWRQTAPALAYGNYHFERTMQALAQATGKPVQWAPEFMGGMEATGIAKDGLPVQPKYAAMQTFGLKVRPIDVEMGEIYDSAAKNKLIREIDAEMRRLGRLNAKGAVSDAAFDREAEKANVKRDRLNDGLTIDGKPKN